MTDIIQLEMYRDMILEEIEDMNSLIYDNMVELAKLEEEMKDEGWRFN